ncbi:hypothetical protein AB0M46_23490 [Dactylosporangium sp. NPDC051485]|uniref:hypothetical protein n=1 Tax=Dactylosporangium sp. NPDC051485 TaxID=3154846 RepID=UPI00341B5253
MNDHPRFGAGDRPQLAVPVTALRSLTMLATGHLAAGEPGLAVALLRAGLLGTDPRTAAPDLHLADAGAVYAAALDPRGAPDSVALRWARYAYRTGVRWRGEDHDRTVAAADVLARVLAAHRVDAQAIDLRRRLVELFTARDGLVAASTVTACVRLAVAEHDAGYCDAGITGLGRAWQRWSSVHGTADLRSVAMLLDLAAMLAACGRFAESAHATKQAFAGFAATGPAAAARPDIPDPLPSWHPAGRNHAALCARPRPRPRAGMRRGHRTDRCFACQELLP